MPVRILRTGTAAAVRRLPFGCLHKGAWPPCTKHIDKTLAAVKNGLARIVPLWGKP